ncbi:uncharacterized protein F5891DRAFT_986888 [Suillus fuscotomentosus]|uniref:Uncharacterized protein n=1 Tax=Suillus fuscotomentosus TaxID=1912939 RepID=A0AAD4DR15_9AGAM|nr:uncharacterized protein F5891DRAFT_986888 [Suillus fuscotomentosus]KAG1890638.1 hypothetical protein F5891DRAFT_986888 [Suillus fuscotomentosus]
MAHPVTYKTSDMKLQAARERRRRHYVKDDILKRQRELRSSKTKESKAANKITKDLSKAVAKLLHCRVEDESKSKSDLESDDDENMIFWNVYALSDIKDEMLELIGDDLCKFVEGVLCNYVKSFPEDSSPGDISIIETSFTKVQDILNRAIAAQDQILNFCGVLPQWHAADTVTHFLRTVLAYLEDIQCLLFSGGICELTVAHSMGEMMYQKGIRI